MSNKRNSWPTPPIALERRVRHGKKIKKGTPYSHIIAKGEDANFEYTLHATKGYRRNRKG